MQEKRFLLEDHRSLQNCWTCPKMCTMENSSPHKAPECHRELLELDQSPKKSGPHLLSKTALTSLCTLTVVPRASTIQHLTVRTGSYGELLVLGTRKYPMQIH